MIEDIRKRSISKLVCEAIIPVPQTFDAAFMSAGVPGLPREFFWRKKKYAVEDVIRAWKSTGPCHHGSSERYVRRHWFKVKTKIGSIMTLYFDKGTHGRRSEMGWFLYVLEE